MGKTCSPTHRSAAYPLGSRPVGPSTPGSQGLRGPERRRDCPYCESSGQYHDQDEGVEGFKRHLFDHVIEEYEAAAGKIAVEFDILSELIEKFGLQTVFKFLHLLGKRTEQADALAHYHIDSRTRSESTINVLNKAFDLSIRARDQRFVSESPPGPS